MTIPTEVRPRRLSDAEIVAELVAEIGAGTLPPKPPQRLMRERYGAGSPRAGRIQDLVAEALAERQQASAPASAPAGAGPVRGNGAGPVQTSAPSSAEAVHTGAERAHWGHGLGSAAPAVNGAHRNGAGPVQTSATVPDLPVHHAPVNGAPTNGVSSAGMVQTGAEPVTTGAGGAVRTTGAPVREPSAVAGAHTGAPVRAAVGGLVTAALGRATSRVQNGPQRPDDDTDETGGVLNGWHVTAALLIAVPAFLAVWSGWIGLGEMTGWGKRNMLPGLVEYDGWATIHTSITLPIGVEAFGALSMAVFLATRNTRGLVRTYSAFCAFGSLALGALGQVAYHVLSTSGGSVPSWLVAFVAVLPVVVLGASVGLIHLAASNLKRHK